MTNHTNPSELTVRQAVWPQDEKLIHSIRKAVFVDEQGVPADLEWDGKDQECTHVLAEIIIGAKRDAVGTGRLMPDGKIGRMAVLSKYRGKGVGGEILTALVEAARARKLTEVYLHAQSHAMAFYQRFGFVVEGDEFQEAGIPHLKMRQTIKYGEQGQQ